MIFESAEKVEAFLDEAQIRHHKVAVTDIDGVLRGKSVSREKFASILRSGFGFCDVVLGWDVADAMYDQSRVSGYHTGYRDAPVKLDLGTLRRVPGEPGTVLMLGQFDGDYAAACPRALLHKLIRKAESLGYFPRGSFEYEFFVFNETPESVRQKGYRNLTPFTPGMFGYSMLRSGVHAGLHQELLAWMQELEAPIEGLHTETGPGVLEAALHHAPLREAADRAELFKTYAKIFFQRRGLMATFMAKWNAELPGQSGHFHLSLENAQGQNLFFNPKTGQTSELFHSFISGQAALLPEFLAMVCSTINAYRRLVPGFWAPTNATWGIENRTTALRGIPGGPKGTRTEYRIGPADANPYLVAAAALASGLYGIEKNLKIAPSEGNAYENPGAAPALPTDLAESTRRFEASEVAREYFGDTFVDHFAMSRKWEVRAFQRHVADWDLARYFEII
jgi:glutamine synthetase